MMKDIVNFCITSTSREDGTYTHHIVISNGQVHDPRIILLKVCQIEIDGTVDDNKIHVER